MTYEDIKKANETIKTTDVKGKDYAEVNQRIKAFRMVCPNGTITTEIISLDNGVITMKSTVLDEDGKILGTGFAQEKENSSFINKTSFIENCETSAVGRALGMCGFGIDTSVASAEEVQNAIKNQKPTISNEILDECKHLNINIENVATYLKKNVAELTDADLKKCIETKKKAMEKNNVKV